MRPSGRAPDEMRAISSIPISRSTPKVRAWSASATPGSLHRQRRGAGPTVPARQKPGLGHGRILDAPRATHTRGQREAAKGKQSGRTQEIQRLIGRSLRAVIKPEKLGERQIVLDCDVIQADGGTRTASISGAWVALRLAVDGLIAEGSVDRGSDRGEDRGDLAAASTRAPRCSTSITSRTSRADADANFVLIEGGKIAEAQATAEGAAYDEEGLLRLLRLAQIGCAQIFKAQEEAVTDDPQLGSGKLVIATHNAGKLKEIAALLAPYGVEVHLGRIARPARAGRDGRPRSSRTR